MSGGDDGSSGGGTGGGGSGGGGSGPGFFARWGWNPFAMDARAVGLLRIFLGLYALMDIGARLAMPGGLHWYTGSDWDPHAVVHVSQTPHGAPPHKVLFYRGPLWLQAALFGLHACIAVAYTAGWGTRWTAWLLWLATASMHGRLEVFHDGSDKYFRNILLWSAFLPLDAAFCYRPLGGGQLWPGTAASVSMPSVFTSIGTIGCVLQVALMYLGTITLRWRHDARWFDGTAVYWSIRQSFAAQPPAFLASYPSLCAVMTYQGVVMETACALLLLLTSVDRPWGRTVSVLVIVCTHVGIYMMFYLPQWQLFAAGISVAFLPTATLDWILGTSNQRPTASADALAASNGLEATSGADHQGVVAKELQSPSSARFRVTARTSRAVDDVTSGMPQQSPSLHISSPMASPSTGSGDSRDSARKCSRQPLRPWSPLKKMVGGFLLCYMVYLWGATDGELYHPADDGDIGQILRFYQGWVMFVGRAGSGRWDTYMRVTGTVRPSGGLGGGGGGVGEDEAAGERVYDVLAGLRTGEWTPLDAAGIAEQRTRPACVSCTYPGWRYERYMSQIPEKLWVEQDRSIKQLQKSWCSIWLAAIDKDLPGGVAALAEPPVVTASYRSYALEDPRGDGVAPGYGEPFGGMEWVLSCET